MYSKPSIQYSTSIVLGVVIVITEMIETYPILTRIITFMMIKFHDCKIFPPVSTPSPTSIIMLG